jgi:hypothetical protein
MNFLPGALNPARFRRGLVSFLTETPPSDAPLPSPFPRNPLFPALRSGHTAVSVAPAISKFRAAGRLERLTGVQKAASLIPGVLA